MIESLTLEITEQVITNITRTIGAAVAVVDSDEGAEGPGLDLALVLEDLVGLDDGHGEIAGGEPSDVAEPEEAVLTFSSGIGVVTEPERFPTARDKTHQCLEHPTSLRNPNPRPPTPEPFPLGAPCSESEEGERKREGCGREKKERVRRISRGAG